MNNIITRNRNLLLNPNIRQFLKYVLVGFLNTGVFYGIYYIMLQFGFFYATAVTVGTVVGIINSYFWNKYFTFKSRKKSVGETLKFLTVYGVQYLSNLFVIFMCINYIGISAELAGIVAIGIGLFISFFGHKFWSFRNAKR
jgi:putative flippase GtrA